MKWRNLSTWAEWPLAIYSLLAGFATYFSMYAFRKPFTAARYEDADLVWGHVDFKIAIIIAQVLGYALSKFIGIKVISELRPERRFTLLIVLVGTAWGALAAFGLAQGSAWSLLWLFVNGLPLGMIWGIVISYMEGRRLSEFLGAGLCASFIVASGGVKSVGAWLMYDMGVGEYWMPFWTGALFFPVLLLGGLLLKNIPLPNAQDVALRTLRQPMDKQQRKVFFRQYAPGLIALVLSYIAVTIYRDFRDNFAAELWAALGFEDATAIFTIAELPIAALVLVMLALTMFIQNNQKAFLLYHWLLLGGCMLIGLSTWLFQQELLRGDWWIVLVGAGLYVVYVPFNAILFDRMIAAFRQVATAGFLIYVADASGYLGSVGALLFKNFAQPELSWLDFFIQISYVTALVSGGAVALALWYFQRKLTK